MSSSKQRRSANRANALLSTGPVTKAGKVTSSHNALRHGLFSSVALLTDEDPEEFQLLLFELTSALQPGDAVEAALVDRIALTLWRQRRLASSETANLELSREKVKIADALSDELGLGYSSKLKPEALSPPDANQLAWCKAVLAEIDAIEGPKISHLRDHAPLIWAQLEHDATEDAETVEDYVSACRGGLPGYLSELGTWCRQQLETAERRPELLRLADLIARKRLLPGAHQLELLSRYQTSARQPAVQSSQSALRDAQEWRLRTIEAVDRVGSSIQPAGYRSSVGFVSQKRDCRTAGSRTCQLISRKS